MAHLIQVSCRCKECYIQWRHLHTATSVPSLPLSFSLLVDITGHNITGGNDATLALYQIHSVVVGNSDKPEGQSHPLVNADIVSVFEWQHIIPAAVDAKVRAVLVGKFLVQVDHDLSRLSECTDHLILPLVDQHPVLQDNTRVSVITQRRREDREREAESVGDGGSERKGE